MELINNTTKTLKDDLSVEIKQGSKVSIAAACFSIYAFQELKEQLSQIEQLRFIFTSPTFVTEKAKKERREFYIPRMTRERSLYGTEFEIKLRNELTQKAIARECAEWIRQKVTFKSNISDKSIQGQIVVDGVGYTPINNFTTVELGCEKGNVISTTIVKDESLARTLLADFNEIWNDSKVLQVVTDEVIDSITAAYNENSPDFIYFVTLYNIFNEFLEDVSEDVLPNEATGFKESKIWGMLYNFQRDAALAIINKLEKFNGCILADSVGLGKTFTALAVIKYYENRNKSVLVLCPKKLTNNWNTYKDNYVNNPIAADRLRYDVLYHTDLNRTHGTSNGLDLDRLNWGNYDLVVIDESHNFRNGGKLVENPDEDTKDNRYVTLMKKVIRAGVKTKEITSLLGIKVFSFPKPSALIKYLISTSTEKNDLVLDFFSGSATTAHAVMQLNAEDKGHRKFIMVQLPEVTDEKSEAYKAGYKNICEIGKERIRRAGKKIQEERIEAIALSKHEWDQTTFYAEHKEECDRLGHLPDEYFAKEHPPIDTGFRVLKCDTSNMKEVYYNPAEYEASLFSRLEDNIKEDRTPEDLLFQVMLDLGVLLSGKIEETTIAGKKVFNVEDNYLIACFDSNVTEETIKAIAKQKPYYFVMRDSSMASDSVATNFDQIFATYSPDTVRKVL